MVQYLSVQYITIGKCLVNKQCPLLPEQVYDLQHTVCSAFAVKCLISVVIKFLWSKQNSSIHVCLLNSHVHWLGPAYKSSNKEIQISPSGLLHLHKEVYLWRIWKLHQIWKVLVCWWSEWVQKSWTVKCSTHQIFVYWSQMIERRMLSGWNRLYSSPLWI